MCLKTGGSHAGVMKLVGEAISSASLDPDKKIVVLGIANWTTVSKNQELIKKNVQIILYLFLKTRLEFYVMVKKLNSFWQKDEENELLDYSLMQTEKSKSERSALLDPNHSNFILVDNSQINVYGGEISFRGKLESAISSYVSKYHHKERSDDDGSTKTPIVILVVEGNIKLKLFFFLKSIQFFNRWAQYVRNSGKFSWKWFALRFYRGKNLNYQSIKF
jgi:hypothetical protein